MSTQTLAGKCAIITGGSRGIGAAIAKEIASAGAKVALTYNSNSKSADEVIAAIQSGGREAIALKADVASTADVKRLFDAAIERFGRVDIVIHSAGAILYKKIAETTDEEFENLWRTNVTGTFNILRESATRVNDCGRVITFSSTTTRLMLPTYGPYVATKGAVEQMTRVAAKEFGPRQITVNAVAPGATATDLFLTGKTQEQITVNAAMTNFGRIGETRDMTGLVKFLASDEARWITGQIIACNGGVA